MRIGPIVSPQVSKRKALHLICKHLINDRGALPQEIDAALNRRNAWLAVEGSLDAASFKAAAMATAARGGSRFEPHRWFCAEDELFNVNGRTYALTNQWGGPDWLEAMRRLKENYRDAEIDFAPSE